MTTPPMTITLTGCKLAPEWGLMEQLISSATKRLGHLTLIRRADNGVDYRGLGTYHLKFTPNSYHGDVIHIDLTVS